MTRLTFVLCFLTLSTGFAQIEIRLGEKVLFEVAKPTELRTMEELRAYDFQRNAVYKAMKSELGKKTNSTVTAEAFDNCLQKTLSSDIANSRKMYSVESASVICGNFKRTGGNPEFAGGFSMFPGRLILIKPSEGEATTRALAQAKNLRTTTDELSSSYCSSINGFASPACSKKVCDEEDGIALTACLPDLMKEQSLTCSASSKGAARISISVFVNSAYVLDAEEKDVERIIGAGKLAKYQKYESELDEPSIPENIRCMECPPGSSVQGAYCYDSHNCAILAEKWDSKTQTCVPVQKCEPGEKCPSSCESECLNEIQELNFFANRVEDLNGGRGFRMGISDQQIASLKKAGKLGALVSEMKSAVDAARDDLEAKSKTCKKTNLTCEPAVPRLREIVRKYNGTLCPAGQMWTGYQLNSGDGNCVPEACSVCEQALVQVQNSENSRAEALRGTGCVTTDALIAFEYLTDETERELEARMDECKGGAGAAVCKPFVPIMSSDISRYLAGRGMTCNGLAGGAGAGPKPRGKN